jgi:hypothetical protein
MAKKKQAPKHNPLAPPSKTDSFRAIYLDDVPMPEAPAPTPAKEKIHAEIYFQTANRLRNAAYWIPHLALWEIVDMGIHLAVEALEKEYNDGKPYRQRASDLKGGRRVKM